MYTNTGRTASVMTACSEVFDEKYCACSDEAGKGQEWMVPVEWKVAFGLVCACHNVGRWSVVHIRNCGLVF